MKRYHYFITFVSYTNGIQEFGNSELETERMVTSYERCKEIEEDLRRGFGADSLVLTSYPHLFRTDIIEK